jgi:hypothetical protein
MYDCIPVLSSKNIHVIISIQELEDCFAQYRCLENV